MTKREDQVEDALIDAAAAQIVAHAAKIDALRDSDPEKLAGRRVLNAMRHNQAAALVNRSMTRDFHAAEPNGGGERAGSGAS